MSIHNNGSNQDRHTAAMINARIQAAIEQRVQSTPQDKIQDRIAHLERKWSIERIVEAEAATTALTGLALAAFINPRLVAIPIAVASMMALHGTKGFYPIRPLLRKIGERTRAELDHEKYQLKERAGQSSPARILADDQYRANIHDRVRRHSPIMVNNRIDREIERSVTETIEKGPAAIRARLAELEKEWDIERVLQVNAPVIALTGLMLSLKDRRWLALPGMVFGFMLNHAVKGWSPPVPVLRNLGFRTQKEIDREKYALRAALQPLPLN